MGTCCKDPSYECRWDDNGQNVKRCQKKSTEPPASSDNEWIDAYGNCTAPNEFCKGENYCVYHSDQYYQCLPSVLGDGDLCGQNDGTNYWRYEACPSGQSCQKKDSEYHCLPYDENETKWVDLYDDCTAINAFCKYDYQCIRHSDFYYQCHPSKLGHGELCGQDDGKNDWLYEACSDGQTCQKDGSDYHCK